MKKTRIFTGFMCAALVASSCNMSNTAKGTGIGATAGAGLGYLIGNFAGNRWLGAAVGAAVGGGAGALIGNKMDKAKAAAEQVAGADVESITDKNGLQAVKVTFSEPGIIFATGKADLTGTSKTTLTQFSQVLKNNTEMDVAICGFTDNTGSDAINNPLSLKRATAVSDYLKGQGVASAQFKTVEGLGASQPIAENTTATGRQKNRRVEVYLYASQEMISQANAGTLK